MESYDPRNPIVKATEDESDEVAGHRFVAMNPAETPESATEAPAGDDDAEVEGHRVIAMNPVEAAEAATEGSADDESAEVQGHRRPIAM